MDPPVLCVYCGKPLAFDCAQAIDDLLGESPPADRAARKALVRVHYLSACTAAQRHKALIRSQKPALN